MTLVVVAICVLVGIGLLGRILTRPALHVRGDMDYIALAIGGICLITGLLQGSVWLYHWAVARSIRHAPAAWMRDYHWPRAGINDGAALALLKNCAGMLVNGIWLAPFHWLAYNTPEARLAFLPLGILDIIWLVLLFFVLRQASRFFRFGAGRLIYGAVPYLLGERLEAVFVGSQVLAGTKAEAELRQVREKWETRRSFNRNETMLYTTKHYSDTRPLTISPSGRATLAFDLPPEGPSTYLGGAPQDILYWEVVVRVNRPGLDYEGIFLVPVYGAADGPLAA
ncbi:MAG: hypothetical protein HY751_06745 [Nitrospinae bacterium]|nr:hypothetical protein [Nitrospinota bacterium]